MIERYVAGVDEAGRGALAGPVVAGAVILDQQVPLAGLADSKKIGKKRRKLLAGTIKAQAVAFALGRAEHTEIDEINILQASLLAMQRAVLALPVIPDLVLVDGIYCPHLSCEVRAIKHGDSNTPVISAASIIAKVERDEYMKTLDTRYPGYLFSKHKGYPTKAHIKALQMLGVSSVHRVSFAPVRRLVTPHD